MLLKGVMPHRPTDIYVMGLIFWELLAGMMPSEGELIFPPNIGFKVKFALSCHDARLLNARYAAIPDNVDLVILEAVPPRPFPVETLTLPALHIGGATSAAV
jgi:hypothetical protein